MRVLVLLSLACFLPGFTSLQPMDRDEPRYAQASKQMLETGRFRRYPLPGRGAAQEAGRHLLDAERQRRHRRGARRSRGAHHHRALSASIPSRRHRNGPADLLGGSGLLREARGLPGRGLHGDLRHPDGRGAAREDRCHADGLLGRGDGRAGPGLSEPGRRRPAAASAADLLDGLCAGHPHQRTAGPDVRGPRGRGSLL